MSAIFILLVLFGSWFIKEYKRVGDTAIQIIQTSEFHKLCELYDSDIAPHCYNAMTLDFDRDELKDEMRHKYFRTKLNFESDKVARENMIMLIHEHQMKKFTADLNAKIKWLESNLKNKTKQKAKEIQYGI